MGCCSIDITLTNLVLLCALFFATKKLYKLFQKWRVEKMLEKWDSAPRDKVILHTVWRGKTAPSVSPFALKLETYLRMAKIPYEIETKDFIGPKGKLPWITYNGNHIGDSQLIIQFLNKKLSVDLNKKTSQEQVATARACRIMLEDHFVWGLVQFRMIENSSNFSQIVKLPAIMKLLMPLNLATIRKRMDSVGMGRHTPTEIYQMTDDDLRTVSVLLGNKMFFGGDEPCEDDAAIFGMVAQTGWAMPGSSFEKLFHGVLSNLKEYCERMKHLYWQDWEQCIDRS